MIADHYILIQRWRRNFLSSAKVEKKVAIWVRILELPLELYDKKFLTRLGSSLGMLLKIDRLTSIHSRGKFARISVEMDLEKPVVPQVIVRGEILKLEYEGLHTICFYCGVYNHKESECNRKVQSLTPPPREEGSSAANDSASAITVVPASEGGQAVVAPNPEFTGSDDPGLLRSDKDGSPGTVTAGMPEQQVTFGPWIVVSRKKKPKGKNVKAWRSDWVSGGQARGKAVLRNDDEERHIRQSSMMEVEMTGPKPLHSSKGKEGVVSGNPPRIMGWISTW